MLYCALKPSLRTVWHNALRVNTFTQKVISVLLFNRLTALKTHVISWLYFHPLKSENRQHVR